MDETNSDHATAVSADPSVADHVSADASVADLFKALGNPVRLHMVRILSDRAAYGVKEETCCLEGEVCVCHITSLFNLSMPTVSHHLKILREAGVVRSRRDGVWIFYSLDPARLHEAAHLLDVFAAKVETA
jgi:ArsR family transcriptional regulator